MTIIPESTQVNTKSLARLFDNKSESYKLFWFKAILHEVAGGRNEIPFRALIERMIVDAWYMVSEYKLNLGPSDTLEKTVLYITEINDFLPTEKEETLLSFLRSTNDKKIREFMRTLSLNVPYGLDASEGLAIKARDQYGIHVETGLIEEWIAREPYDGIWCCAALMHIDDVGCRRFFENLQYNLKSSGAVYISVKTGIETGVDNTGRYFRNFREEDIYELLGRTPNFKIKEKWYTEDSLSRTDFKWLNVIITKFS